ncbi:MAG: N-acetylmuramoyl-L-alanine amidase [Erythrobacter sp.]|jgi:predicted chitinase/peptidoglycan hydrolase-like protein with peptidoglycan-binding domain|uniref:N-acetylmuramoyl-L-alanine amidase n=1 Tax=Qipengyuania citrea TaxID=225971 RepID=UPI00209F323E|nr:N-acetylmuramoyl-L-alanine amidase [Qipengyuania citrea]MCP2018988.1 putative chitinase/peptidoglycan hydrolase-like protein with peptidoglycan-binding domain [Qipengyuania citrea]MDE0902825.1 N-acetylmuramoyl-L-alanine amidase [Erythrobacter sp.]
MSYSLSWLPEVLERAGLKVAETPDWRTRGRGDMGPVRGVLCHHTATRAGGNMPTLDMLIHGRPDLRGPLCHLGLGRDGTYYVVAAGRANHAGPGAWEGLRNTGNTHLIGIEGENGGRPHDDWPEIQMDAYRRGVAAILDHIGAKANMCLGHKEWAPGRKPDPLFDMSQFRSQVAEILAGKSPPPPIAASDDQDRPTLRRGMRADAVKTVQALLGLQTDGIFGPQTEAAIRAWQRTNGLVPDGIVGPRSWEMLDLQRDAPAKPPQTPPAKDGNKASDTAIIDQIDVGLLKLAFSENTPQELAKWAEPIKTVCLRYGIDTRREICSFLANIAVESRGLTRMTESLNYSVDGLLRTFGRHRISEADARRLGRKRGERGLSLARQEELANLLYGGEWGRRNLGNTEPGDGWRFRGYGPKQITGRHNCTEFGKSIGMAIEKIPDYLRTREGGCMGAGWYWKSRDLDKFAATPGLEDDRRAINGGLHGLDVVQERFDRLMRELDRRGV